MAGCRWFVLTLSLILTVGLSIPAGAQLLPLTVPQSIPVILQIAPTGSITTIASALGATVVDSIPGTNTYLLNVPLVLPTFNVSLLGSIQSAEINLGVSLPGFAVLNLVTIPGTVAPDWYKNQPAWQLIESQKALQYATTGGRGIVIADINSRVHSHPALAGHLITGYDFVDGKPSGSTALHQSDASFLDQSDASFLDQSDASFLDSDSIKALLLPPDLTVNPAYSHGTLCAGVIAAIAPGSMIMPLRAFDDNGRSDLFTLAKAIRYAVNPPSPTPRAQVINMSFGTNYPSRTLQSAIQYAQQNGVLLTASAGNADTSRPQYPAAYSGVMTTAATDLLDKKAAFSNYGRYIFVDAPGVHIISAYPGGYYSIVSGTSFSAPTVAGTAALVLSVRLTGVAHSIAGGAVNINRQNPNYVNQLGYGRIDVLRAVKPH